MSAIDPFGSHRSMVAGSMLDTCSALEAIPERYAEPMRDAIHSGNTPTVLGNMLGEIGTLLRDVGHASSKDPAIKQATTPLMQSVSDILYGMATMVMDTEHEQL